METQSKTVIDQDLANKKVRVVREFAAPVAQVWKAWTESKFLDLWWAPKPWKTNTKTMDFREGGYWLYAMEGPDGEKSWARADYQNIAFLKNYQATDAFCDENGEINIEFPRMQWHCGFEEIATGTRVIIEIIFAQEADITKIMELGFAEGFTSALTNLDALIAEYRLAA